jgi:hypothetical protein
MRHTTLTLFAVLAATGLLGTISVYLVQPAHGQATCATGGAGSGGSASASLTSAATGDTICAGGAGVTEGACAATSLFGTIACVGK